MTGALAIQIENVAPTVDLGPNRSASQGQAFAFSASIVGPGVNDTHTVVWDFGDGAQVTGPISTTHAYSAPGTYTVRVTATDRDGGVGTDTLQVTVSSATAQPVRPVLECVSVNPAGGYTARFGYRNDNSVAVTLVVGSANKFTPNPQNRNQPTLFQPGRQVAVFEVPFSGGNLVWTLNGRTSTASPNSTRCP